MVKGTLAWAHRSLITSALWRANVGWRERERSEGTLLSSRTVVAAGGGASQHPNAPITAAQEARHSIPLGSKGYAHFPLIGK
jgi:hypothetical protein